MRFSAAFPAVLGLGLILTAVPVTLHAMPLGGDASTAGYSAKQILQSGAMTDGLYWIDPNGGSTADAFQV